MFSPSTSLPEICDVLEKAAYDPRIKGVVLRVGLMQIGWARLADLTRYIELFKKSGKPSFAYMETAGEKEYYIACMCDKVYLAPEGNLLLLGF